MNTSEPDPRDRRPALARDVALIILVGVGLGLAYNYSMLLANDDRALSWVVKERATGVLELPATPAATPGAGTTNAPAPARASEPVDTAPAPAELSSTTAHDTLAQALRAGKKRSPDKTAGTKKPSGATTMAKPAAGTAPAATPATSVPPPASSPAQPAAAAPEIPDTREPLEARLAVVKALFDAGAAVFADARTAEEYAAGHIAGAISLPFDDVFKKPELAKQLQDQGHAIVTYCDGGDCELSKDLAFSLIDAGHKKVLFFKDGLPGWKSAGYPVHTGSQP